MNATLKFTFEKETKGAVRYQEVGDDGAPAFAPQIGTLYIRKTAMPGGYPINVINNVRNVSEVATIYCATSNPYKLSGQRQRPAARSSVLSMVSHRVQ